MLIAFTAELSVSDYFSKLSTEDMVVSASVDAASYFSLPFLNFVETKFEKGSLTKTCHEYVTRS
jgi:hypothetical protein